MMNGRWDFRWLAWRGVALIALWGIWWTAVGGVGIIAYRLAFHFDAANPSNWIAVWRHYASGATVPFDFVATAGGLAIIGGLGSLVLGLRLGRLSRRLDGWWPSAFPFVRPIFPPIALPRFRHRGNRSAAQGAAGVPAMEFVAMLGRLLARWGRSRGRESFRRRILPAGAERPSAPAGAPTALGDGGGVVAADRIAPADLGAEGAGAVTADSAAVTDAPPADTDADYAVFGRVMALFEVWSDAAPDWMQAALRDEMDMLSEAGWRLFAAFGEPAMTRLETIAAAGLLPADPAKRALLQGLLERSGARDGPADPPFEASAAEMAARQADDTPPLAPSGNVRLSMSAAWLCEMVDNFVMLEEIRADGDGSGAASFDDRWGAIFRETGERLKIAMQAMTDEDWRSIDQFPDRAGRIRVLTDRLREDLRIIPAQADGPGRDGGGQVSSSRPETPPFPPMPAISPLSPLSPPSPPSPPSPAVAGDDAGRGSVASMSLEEILRAAGYVVRTLPALRAGSSCGPADYLAQRDDFSVLLHVADLAGGIWRLDGDSLAPWQGGAGHALPSPCRAVWQRLALLRSVGKQTTPSAGVVVLTGGRFSDEPAVARIIEDDRRRTDVDLAWLDRASSALPDLPAWLVRLESSRSKAARLG